MLLAEMKTEEFNARYARTIADLWQGVEHRYNVTEREFAERLLNVVNRSGNGGESYLAPSAGAELLSHIKAGELCLAVACEKGDDAAWLAFEKEYRHAMQGAARALTKDEAEAEDVVQFVFGELFGIRLDGDRRISKLAHYSGRGSLGGWLRAVVYQAFIDRKRQTARFEQVEDVAEFDRLAAKSEAVGRMLSAPVAQPDEIEDSRLRRVTEEAMTLAFAAMEPKDRLMLNYYYFDDLTLREIGQLVRVHEATISRWLARAQKNVRKKTEEVLQRNYGLRRAEVAECLQMAARSEVDVRRLLGEAAGAAVERTQ